jgi:LysR family transcriptional regulator, regulator for metE and metH
MEVKFFKLVIAIAEAGSLVKAADKLFLTQSALSHQLKEVEAQVGLDLFDRVGKKMILTNSGKLFLSYSYSILSEIKKLKAEVKRNAAGEIGRIRLTTEATTCYHWLPKILKQYQTEFPNVDVRLSSNPSNKPLKLLVSGKVDFAIVHRVNREKNIEFIEIFTDEVIALVPCTDPLSKKRYLTHSDFKNVSYITHSKKHDESAFFEVFLKPNHVMPKKWIYIQLTEAVVAMVKEGLGVAVLSNWLAKPYLDSEKLKAVRITRKGISRKWFIAVLKSNNRPKYFDRFIHHVKVEMQAKKV